MAFDDQATPAVFSVAAADRIAVVVKTVEEATPAAGDPRGGRSVGAYLWAKITSSTLVGSQTRHAWTQQHRDTPTAPTWVDYPNGLSGTTTVDFAVNADDSATATGKYVLLRSDFVDDKLVWTIVQGAGISVLGLKLTAAWAWNTNKGNTLTGNICNADGSGVTATAATVLIVSPSGQTLNYTRAVVNDVILWVRVPGISVDGIALPVSPLPLCTTAGTYLTGILSGTSTTGFAFDFVRGVTI